MGDRGIFESSILSLLGTLLDAKDAQDSVINFFDPTVALPVAPTVGDRYIASATANGWTIDHIYECVTPASWLGQIDITPNEGYWLTVEDLNAIYYFNGTSWVDLANVLDHTKLMNIGVKTHATIDSELDNEIDIHVVTNEPTGCENRTDSVIAFDDGTLTFSITPTGADFTYWLKGVKQIKSAVQSKVISNVEGLHFVYFDAGVLSESTTWNDNFITEKTLIGIVYWDATNSTGIIVADERHGITMDGFTHLYNHDVFGAQWVLGLALGNLTVDGNGASDTHAQCSVSDGKIYDEDIGILIVDDTPQDLSTIAEIPVYYRDGASGYWRKTVATDFPAKRFGVADRLAWNELTGGAWQQTEITNNQFVLSHIFATNDILNPIICIQGQSDYNNVVSAREGATTEINNLVTSGLPSAEFTPIGTIIFQTSDAYGNTVKARIRSTDTGENYVDWRGAGISQSSSANSHADLSDLDYPSSGHTDFQRDAYESAAAAPGINNDGVDTAVLGRVFEVSDQWIKLDTDTIYECTDNSTGAASWINITTGGDVTGPGSSTDNAIARYHLATGKIIQDSLATVDDAGSINIPTGETYDINGTPLDYSDVGAAPAAEGVTNGDSHDHNGGDGGTIAHTSLNTVGVNDHHNEDHQAEHNNGAGDALKLDDLATPDDNTDLDVSVTVHGLVPKAPNDATKYLDGTGVWAVPPIPASTDAIPILVDGGHFAIKVAAGAGDTFSANNPVNILHNAHGLNTGDMVTVRSTDDAAALANDLYEITVVDVNNFTVPFNGTAGGGTCDWQLVVTGILYVKYDCTLSGSWFLRGNGSGGLTVKIHYHATYTSLPVDITGGGGISIAAGKTNTGNFAGFGTTDLDRNGILVYEISANAGVHTSLSGSLNIIRR